MICQYCGSELNESAVEEWMEILDEARFVELAREVLDGARFLTGAGRQTIENALGILEGLSEEGMLATVVLGCLCVDEGDVIDVLREALRIVEYEHLQLELAGRV